MKKTLLIGFGLLMQFSIWAQDRQDKANYDEATENMFYKNIQEKTDSFRQVAQEKNKKRYRLTMDYSNIDIPKSNDEFTMVEAEKPQSQGVTGTCWCFSATSFYEAEEYRLNKKIIPLSELYTVYWQYVEKVKEYVRTRGASLVDEGSETNAVQEMMSKYGAVPASVYDGLLTGQPFYDHAIMMDEIRNYLATVKAQSAWNEDVVVSTIKSILNHYIGTPPESFNYEGKNYTPKSFLKDVVKLNPNDYVTIMSLKSEPFWTKAEYKVPDNWWHSTNYYNVPLDNFMNTIKEAIKHGYSIAVGGDVSESGIDKAVGVMMVPSYDVPSSAINDDARLMRFLNGATTDDHAMHLVGYKEAKNGTWFLVKDSGSGGFNSNHPGYWYIHEDYVKLKFMTATMHKDAVKSLMTKMK